MPAESLIARTPYLEYLVGEPTLEPLLGRKAVMLFAILGFAVLAAVLGWSRRRLSAY